MAPEPPSILDLAGERIPVLRWPEEAATRERLALAGTPRLLLVGHDDDPPEVVDDLEDWLREPVTRREVLARSATLRRRRARRTRPSIDGDGILRFESRWVAVPDAQVAVATLLVENLDRVVSVDDITRAYVESGGTGSSSSIKALVFRLGQRFAEVGLLLHAVRGRGVLLEVPR